MTTPVIIEAAINGFVTKARNPHVPREPGEVAEDGLRCFEAGAAVLHTHIDLEPTDASMAAARYLAGWLPIIEKKPDALVFPTMHFERDGSHGLSHVETLSTSGGLRICPIDPGSIMWGTEVDGLPAGNHVFVNSYDDIAAHFEVCQRYRLGPNMAIWEPGMLRTVLAWWSAGKLPEGGIIKFYFSGPRGLNGVPFGLPPTEAALDLYLDMLGGCTLPWSVALLGGDLVASEVAPLALERGGHLNLGIEFFGGERQPSNEDLVREAVALSAKVGRPIASCREAAEILGLPRGHG